MNNINKLVLAIGFTLTTFPSLAAGFQCGEHVTQGYPVNPVSCCAGRAMPPGTTTTPRSLTGSLTG